METPTNTSLLEVGNVLYEYSHYGIGDGKWEVKRVTSTQAIIEGGNFGEQKKVKRELTVNGGVGTNEIGRTSYTVTYYRLASIQLETEWIKKRSIEKIKEVNWRQVPAETIAKVVEALELEIEY